MESNLLMFFGETSRHIFSLCTFLFLVKGPRLVGVDEDSSPRQARLLQLRVPSPASREAGLGSQEIHMQTYIYTCWPTQMYVDSNTQHSHDSKQHWWPHSVPLSKQAG